MAESIETRQPKWGEKLSRYCLLPQRNVLAIMGFLAIVNCYATRVCLPHAITVLVHKRKNDTYKLSNLDKYRYCPRDDNFYTPSGTYYWSEMVQGFILSSFYIGYMITPIPGVLLTDRYGGKWILTMGMIVSGLSSALSPLAIDMGGFYGLMGMRCIMGLGQGLVFPALNGMIDSWVPLSERANLGGNVIVAGVLGSFFGNLLSGLLLVALHWSFVFIVFGVSTLLWCPFFLIFCFSYPATHPCISQKEIDYLNQEMENLDYKKRPPIPWRDILSSGPIFALIFVQIGHDWTMSLIVNGLPKYYSQVQGIAVLENGLYTSMPFLLYGITGIIFGYIGDFVILKNYMSVTHLRRLMTVIAAWVPGVFIISASYCACERTFVIALFCLCMASMGPYFTGMKLTPMDLSPNNAGFIVGVTSSIGAIAGFLAPTTAGLITPEANMFQWRLVFWFAFAILFFTAIVFLLYGSGDLQPYDEPDDQKAESGEKTTRISPRYG